MIEIKPLEKSVNASLNIPGSKSYTNRSLILAALTKGRVRILNPLVSDDTSAMILCLKELGIEVKVEEGAFVVSGDISEVKDREYSLDANLSGTTIRFILALSAIVPGVKTITGKEGLNKRPIGELVNALRALGAEIEYLDNEGFPPLRVKSSKLNSGVVKLRGDVSSQFFSALLMITPLVGDIEIETLNEPISKPYIDMTIDLMEKFGVSVKNEDYKKYSITKGQSYKMDSYSVEGDFSSAGYFFALAALTKSTLTLHNLNPNSKQADRGFLKILEEMGSEITLSEEGITIAGKGVKSISVNMEDCPDQIQTMAVLAAFAQGVTKIYGTKSLKIKETDRVTALENELNKMGIRTLSDDNSLTIYGGSPRRAVINTYGDHRMAMSFALAGAKIKGVRINNPEVVTKTFPGFWEALKNIGVEIN